NLTVVNAETFTLSATSSIGKSLMINDSATTLTVSNTITLTAGATVGGNFDYIGGNKTGAASNVVSLAGAFITGDAGARLGNSVGAATNTLTLTGGVIGANLTVIGGLGGDMVVDGGGTTIGGNIYVDLGIGNNAATFAASSAVGGTSFAYRGGTGNDTVN